MHYWTQNVYKPDTMHNHGTREMVSLDVTSHFPSILVALAKDVTQLLLESPVDIPPETIMETINY